MKKIMFNDRFGLTEAVLAERKTMTRMVMNPQPSCVNGDGHIYNDSKPPKYKVGEIVAVAQCLRDMGYNPRDTKHRSGEIWGLDHSVAWTNKSFVFACECVHQIRITSVRVERLQDISEFDCLREGIRQYGADGRCFTFSGWNGNWASSARVAFAALIDKVSGKGAWASNPWVFVYEFELVKED